MFTHFLTKNGELFSCGYDNLFSFFGFQNLIHFAFFQKKKNRLNWYGQLGVGHDNNIDGGNPEKIEIFHEKNEKNQILPKRVLKISCGFAHALILTEDYNLYHVGQSDGANNIKPLLFYSFK